MRQLQLYFCRFSVSGFIRNVQIGKLTNGCFYLLWAVWSEACFYVNKNKRIFFSFGN